MLWALCLLLVLGPDAVPTTDRPLEALPEVERDEDRARAAFEQGAQAYADGRFVEAIAAFEESYRYSGRAGPLFSLGQAHRRRWEAADDHTQRQLAILRFTQYLELDPDGRRRLEAERHIAELDRYSELEGIGEPLPVFTRLSITSPTQGAMVSIDDADPVGVPVAPDVEPGRHEIRVSAPGFESQSRTVDVPEGSTVTIALELDPQPARLQVDAPEGSDLYVDGVFMAQLPSAEDIVVEPGKHQIGVARRGRSLFVRELRLERGQTHRVDAPLEVTGQRKVAFTAIGVGSGAVLVSATLTTLALLAQRDAKAIVDEQAQGSISIERERERRELVARRDALRSTALATGITGAVVALTGIVLHVSDQPPIASQLGAPSNPAERGSGRARKTKRVSRRGVRPVGGGPMLGPGQLGVTIEGRF